MPHQEIDDRSQMKPGDYLEYRCPRFGRVTQWKVVGVYLGAYRVESLIALEPITNRPAEGHDTVMVPEQMTRTMTVIRGENIHP